jgi:heme/copper-type cytochrome/quinol oxidase subunit 4
MNDERMPINLFTVDCTSGHEMSEEEIKAQKKEDCKPWRFLIGFTLLVALVFIFMNIKATNTFYAWIWIGIYVVLALLIVFSFIKIKKIKNVKKVG